MNVILSIKPKFAEAIFAGKKEVEFRKTLFKKYVDKVLVYSTAPVQKIVGYFTIADIVESSPHQLWQRFGNIGYINEEEFFNYYRDAQKGYSLCIATAYKFNKSIDPHVLVERFIPPQSFRYYEGDIDTASHCTTVFNFKKFTGNMNLPLAVETFPAFLNKRLEGIERSPFEIVLRP